MCINITCLVILQPQSVRALFINKGSRRGEGNQHSSPLVLFSPSSWLPLVGNRGHRLLIGSCASDLRAPHWSNGNHPCLQASRYLLVIFFFFLTYGPKFDGYYLRVNYAMFLFLRSTPLPMVSGSSCCWRGALSVLGFSWPRKLRAVSLISRRAGRSYSLCAGLGQTSIHGRHNSRLFLSADTGIF